jgi:serine/threonine-protein kinase HipA
MTPTKRSVGVALGQSAIPLGSLTYAKDGRREHSTFAYDSDVADVMQKPGFRFRPTCLWLPATSFARLPSKEDSIFHFAFADTEPDGWGCRVIARDHAKRRRSAQAKGNQITNGRTE